MKSCQLWFLHPEPSFLDTVRCQLRYLNPEPQLPFSLVVEKGSTHNTQAADLMLRPSDYCELNRRFVQYKHDRNSGDFALASYDSDSQFFRWASEGWDDLLKNGGVAVILGEPGSGRSYEFKARCQALHDEGSCAFYLELHRLVTESPSQILDEVAALGLQKWRQSTDHGVFFLDAVDEAKLERISDFSQALKNFAKTIGTSSSKATIFISSRITEWMPETDVALVTETLSPAIIAAGQNEAGAKPSKCSTLPVYAIAPLDRQQVARLATHRGIAHVDGFISALDENHAWEFARRPWDVRFLVNYWATHQSIGSLTEMLEESLLMLLKEREEKRQRSVKFPLPVESARVGAEMLAAATVFCRKLDFEVPDSVGAIRTRGMNPLACLPTDWTDIQCGALLDRPLFDSAMYGRVRFHHRRMAEYLAANWLKRRMDNQCPPPVLHDLLFAKNGNRRILKPSRAAIAVWLACIADDGWTRDLRNWILEAAPNAFLRYGDPSKLPVAFRNQIINAFVAKFQDRNFVRVETEKSAMSRLADPALGESLAKHLLDPNVGEGVKVELMEFAYHGKVRDCLQAALTLLRSAPQLHELESYSIRLIEELEDPAGLRELERITRNDKAFAARHLGLLARVLFPSHLDVKGLGSLLQLRSRSSDVWYLKSLFAQSSEEWCPFEVLKMLVSLADPQPRKNVIAAKHAHTWVRELIYPLLERTLNSKEISSEFVPAVARACWLVRQEHPDTSEFDHAAPSWNLNEATKRFSQVRRETFWIAIEHERGNSVGDPKVDGCMAFQHSLHFDFCEMDFAWLLEDCRNSLEETSRATAAWLAVAYLDARNHPWNQTRQLLEALVGAPTLSQAIRRRIWAFRRYRLVIPWYRLKQTGIFTKRFWRRRFSNFSDTTRSLRDRWWLHRKIRHLRSGKFVSCLEKLTRGISDSGKWAVSDWSKLVKKWGARITAAVQSGCVAVWKDYEPDTIRNSDGIPLGVIVGLTGLQYLHGKGELQAATRNPKDALRAAKYAVNEMNGYSDWLPEIAQNHPAVVRGILCECIEHEWNAEFMEGYWPRHLGHLSNEESTLAPLIAPFVAALLGKSEPANSAVLSYGLTLLLHHGGIHREDLARIAGERLSRTETKSASYLTWLSMCLQTNASEAVAHLEKRVVNEKEAWQNQPNDNFMVVLCAGLGERHASVPAISEPDHLHHQHAERFVRLVYQCIDPGQDIQRSSGESYSPTPRDDAQRYRGALLPIIAKQTEPQSDDVLISLLSHPELKREQDWIRHLLDERVERMSDDSSFEPQDIRDFEDSNEGTPRSAKDLFQIVLRRLQAIKHDVEQADDSYSLKANVRVGDREIVLRRFVARELSLRRNGKYTAPQEPVIQNEERLDIRVENPDINGPVVIEVKLGDLMGRSINSLLGDLENQLVDRYLRDEHSRHGVFIVGHTGERENGWQHPATGGLVDFEEVISILAKRADEIQKSNPNVEELKVIGIDFRVNRRPLPG